MDEHPGHPTVGYLVWRLSMKWRAAVDVAVTHLGLTHAQYSVLASLRGLTRTGASPSQRELADHTGLDPIYISKLARALEAAGLVERIPDAHDARAVCLTVTPEGIRIIDRAVLIVRDLLEELTAPLGGAGSSRTRALMHDLQLLIAEQPNPIAEQPNP
jgi:MarR family transcriptional regulator, organic hydroperoxide resistance regulator